MAILQKVKTAYETWRAGTHAWAVFELLSVDDPCVKSKVIAIYKSGYPTDKKTPVAKERKTKIGQKIADKIFELKDKAANISAESRSELLKDFNPNDINNIYAAARWVWKNRRADADIIIEGCYNANNASPENTNTSKDSEVRDLNMDDIGARPFDRRLDRLELNVNKDKNGKNSRDIMRVVPFASDYAELSTTGYLISRNSLELAPDFDKKAEAIQKAEEEYRRMKSDDFYYGVPALQNQYALVRLYGANSGSPEGVGKYLVNQKNQRRWYEVDVTADAQYNFASTPTTSALISWGNGDPYGRTPYQFTDFVFSKYWNKIPNNRLITLRRYAAPILDNLKFPGMNAQIDTGGSQGDTPAPDAGSSSDVIAFPPMASAITYFGGETSNTLGNLLKFTTGVPWEDAQAGVWEVSPESTPDNASGPGALYGGIAKFAQMLNVAGGNFNRELIMNNGQLPPDPYLDGPYENRIKGPINRIDSVKKRKAGMEFSWDGLNIVFEYVARPIGGISPKAVLLDILSNFLVIGSASAVFFGGAHRFVAAPAKYPFIGGAEGIEKWYRGDPIGWGLTAIKQFTQGGSDEVAAKNKQPEGSGEGAFNNILSSLEGFFNQLFSGQKGSGFGALTNLFSGGIGNLVGNAIATRTAGQIPFLSGMKAILTGEPVGEWHVTIGNPLNPIAMIGNLICEGIDVEFNEEIGPDDFPTEMKITVKLKHAMGRDRDAIESIFNRGMGRIYQLPDSYKGSADYQTTVDKATKTKVSTGTAPNRKFSIMYKPGMDSGYMSPAQAAGVPNPMGGEVSIWNRAAFNLGISENSAVQLISKQEDIFKSVYRTADWIAQSALV